MEAERTSKCGTRAGKPFTKCFMQTRLTNDAANAYDSPASKFTGKERDTESGLDNFGKRYNASSLGRFMSPDPVAGSAWNPQDESPTQLRKADSARIKKEQARGKALQATYEKLQAAKETFHVVREGEGRCRRSVHTVVIQAT